jgi:hypothetical protein
MYYIPRSSGSYLLFMSVGRSCRLTFLTVSSSVLSAERALRTATYNFLRSIPFSTQQHRLVWSFSSPHLHVTGSRSARSSFVRLHPISDPPWILITLFELHQVPINTTSLISRYQSRTKATCLGHNTSHTRIFARHIGMLPGMLFAMDFSRGSSPSPRTPHSECYFPTQFICWSSSAPSCWKTRTSLGSVLPVHLWHMPLETYDASPVTLQDPSLNPYGYRQTSLKKIPVEGNTKTLSTI